MSFDRFIYLDTFGFNSKIGCIIGLLIKFDSKLPYWIFQIDRETFSEAYFDYFYLIAQYNTFVCLN